MALWGPDETGKRTLYIVEAQDGWYWPRHGQQKNKFSDWKVWAQAAGFNVAILPLKDEIRKTFNETAVWEKFNKLEGNPYGYANFLFGWIDTPRDNLPFALPAELAVIGFAIVEKIDKPVMDKFFSEAMNKRLGSKNLSILELEVEAAKQGKSLFDVWSIIEQDEWIYEHSKGINYVCSSFVVAMYKAAGILPQNIQGTEFTPRDVYMLDIFEKNPSLPEKCKAADPMLPYCQILGNYRIELGPEYGSLKPYEHMNEKCPSKAPKFERPAGCCST